MATTARRTKAPPALTLADVTLRLGETTIAGPDVATALRLLPYGTALREYLDFDECSLEIRGIADTLDLLAESEDRREASALYTLARTLHHLADRVDDLRPIDAAASAAKYTVALAPKGGA